MGYSDIDTPEEFKKIRNGTMSLDDMFKTGGKRRSKRGSASAKKTGRKTSKRSRKQSRTSKKGSKKGSKGKRTSRKQSRTAKKTSKKAPKKISKRGSRKQSRTRASKKGSKGASKRGSKKGSRKSRPQKRQLPEAAKIATAAFRDLVSYISNVMGKGGANTMKFAGMYNAEAKKKGATSPVEAAKMAKALFDKDTSSDRNKKYETAIRLVKEKREAKKRQKGGADDSDEETDYDYDEETDYDSEEDSY